MVIMDFIQYGVLLVVLIYAVIIYNGLVRLKNNVDRCFANIEVVLKQRHTELPQLVEVCKGYMKHEREVLVAVTEARNHVHEARQDHDVRELGKAESEMRTSLAALFVRIEAYPELKADKNLLALQERISQLEDSIADRRETYNESVRLNNTRVDQLPDMLLARLFKFGALEYLEFEEADLRPVNVGSMLRR